MISIHPVPLHVTNLLAYLEMECLNNLLMITFIFGENFRNISNFTILQAEYFKIVT